MGDSRKADAVYLEACRVKRNIAEYDIAGAATERDALELYEFTVTVHASERSLRKQPQINTD